MGHSYSRSCWAEAQSQKRSISVSFKFVLSLWLVLRLWDSLEKFSWWKKGFFVVECWMWPIVRSFGNKKENRQILLFWWFRMEECSVTLMFMISNVKHGPCAMVFRSGSGWCTKIGKRVICKFFVKRHVDIYFCTLVYELRVNFLSTPKK
jgi:hypothetical protein